MLNFGLFFIFSFPRRVLIFFRSPFLVRSPTTTFCVSIYKKPRKRSPFDRSQYKEKKRKKNCWGRKKVFYKMKIEKNYLSLSFTKPAGQPRQRQRRRGQRQQGGQKKGREKRRLCKPPPRGRCFPGARRGPRSRTRKPERESFFLNPEEEKVERERERKVSFVFSFSSFERS